MTLRLRCPLDSCSVRETMARLALNSGYQPRIGPRDSRSTCTSFVDIAVRLVDCDITGVVDQIANATRGTQEF